MAQSMPITQSMAAIDDSSESNYSPMSSEDELEIARSIVAISAVDQLRHIDTAIERSSRKAARMAMKMGAIQSRLAYLYSKKRTIKNTMKKEDRFNRDNAQTRWINSPQSMPAGSP